MFLFSTDSLLQYKCDQNPYIICLYATGITTAVQCGEVNYRNDVGWI